MACRAGGRVSTANVTGSAIVCAPSAEMITARAVYPAALSAAGFARTETRAGVMPARGCTEIQAGGVVFGDPPSSRTVNRLGDWSVEVTRKDCETGASPATAAEKARLPAEVCN